MAVETTGSIVNGLNIGLRNHFKGVSEVISLLGDPSALVNPVQAGAAPSGGCIGYDKLNDQLYYNVTGSTWYKLGSVE